VNICDNIQIYIDKTKHMQLHFQEIFQHLNKEAEAMNSNCLWYRWIFV